MPDHVMKIKIISFVFVCFLLFVTKAFGQQNKGFLQVGLSGLFGSQKSIYQNGYGVNAAQLWAISPSFNLGPELSAYSISSRLGSNNLQAFSTQFDVYYFPKKLIEGITKKESTFLNGFYFCLGIGHNFKTNDVFDNNVLNAAHFGLGYNFCGSSCPFYVSLCANSFALSPGFTDEQVKNNGIFTVNIGATIFKKK